MSSTVPDSSPLKYLVRGLILVFLFLFACQPKTTSRVRLIVDGQVHGAAAGDLIPAHILTNAAISFSPEDRVLLNGMQVAMDSPLPSRSQFTLQLRRAIPVTLVAPQGQMTLNTAAWTVGEALHEAGVSLSVSDSIQPSANTPVTSGMMITFTPGRELTIQTAGQTVRVRSSAATVGQVLAEAGIPLIGLDTSTPSENDPLPADGQIHVVHITESITSAFKVIPYETQLIVTTDLQPPAQDVQDPGEVGISLDRTRIRYEDGVETSRVVESQSVIRLPRTRVVRSSYWASMQMYATSYSPCRSDGEPGKCYYGTSLGIPVAKGVVGFKLDWYLALRGLKVYIPGYGNAIVADTSGSNNCFFPDCRPAIDLGYSDNDYVGWSSWVTVYFLAPEPPSIPWFLQ